MTKKDEATDQGAATRLLSAYEQFIDAVTAAEDQGLTVVLYDVSRDRREDQEVALGNLGLTIKRYYSGRGFEEY
jgi:hypothetical protein